MSEEKKLFCFGLGYSARYLAHRLSTKGWRIGGTVRDSGRAEALCAEGIEAVAFDGAAPLERIAPLLESATHLLISIPPGEDGDPVLGWHASDLAAKGDFRWIGYLSTTGVYGSRDGGWVEETSDLRPNSARSRARAEAEKAWLNLHRNSALPVHIFRLAGIYGPGRSPLEAATAGRARRIDRPGQAFSRIHVEDIARTLEASIARPNPGAIYNLCDNEPAEPRQVTEYACALLGIDPPPLVPFAEAELSPMAKTFWADNKRVSNRRIRKELGVELAFPSYREGLRALRDG